MATGRFNLVRGKFIHYWMNVSMTVMKCCNLLLLLRIVTVFFGLLVARNSFVIFMALNIWANTTNSVQTAVSKRSVIQWRNVDIFAPPKLRNSLEEAFRLNELLSRVQYKCQKSIIVGKGNSAFKFCAESTADDTTIGDSAFISGSPDDFQSFLTSLNTSRWTFFVPDGFALLDYLGDVDAEMHYLRSIKEHGYWDENTITEELAHRSFDAALINVYSPYVSNKIIANFNAPKFASKILKCLSAKHVQLVVKFDKADADDTIYLWYLLLYQMFFQQKYALIGAEVDSFCDYFKHSCRYRLSFMRVQLDQVELPVFGFGSPLEEKKRLLNYLTHVETLDVSCKNRNGRSDIPLLCFDKDFTGNTCVILYLRYRHFAKLDFTSLKPCRVILFTPLQLKHGVGNAEKVYHYGVSYFSTENTSVPGEDEQIWDLITLRDMLRVPGTEKIDTVIFDLEGGEWDIFSAILEVKEMHKIVRKIEMRLRLWIGEESENYRRFLWYFLRLEELGYKLTASDVEDSTVVTVAYV